MNELALTFFILGSGCSLAIPLVSKLMADGNRHKANLLLVLACSAFGTYALAQINTSYQANNARTRANENERTLKGQIASLTQQNAVLSDQIANSNAQLAALRERLHAPARFKVTVRESLATQDSVTSEIPANPTSF
jgi:hypothetical protein